jgi:predicted thioesterase
MNTGAKVALVAGCSIATILNGGMLIGVSHSIESSNGDRLVEQVSVEGIACRHSSSRGLAFDQETYTAHVTNLSDRRASFDVTAAWFDDDDRRITTGTAHVDGVPPGQRVQVAVTMPVAADMTQVAGKCRVLRVERDDGAALDVP